eukprot:TRINITY_DN2138_c0_g1_i2.p1 TRINITY_DN2138_c0_g1~~TRINITY_DN2138_c0_g1_i2.p1  ORF type:complete len:138 (-),score=37.15 TRINITY_DN2138_c0_g1_i2:50-406(-)
MVTILQRCAGIVGFFTAHWEGVLAVDELDLDELLSEFDTNQDGKVSFQEADAFFLRRIPRFQEEVDEESTRLRKLFDELLESIFRDVDADVDGFLHKTELAELMGNVAKKVEEGNAEM